MQAAVHLAQQVSAVALVVSTVSGAPRARPPSTARGCR